MVIVAFLQNMWLRDPARYQRHLARWVKDGAEKAEQFRLKTQARALFAGCLTGRRLRAALGDDLCQEIVWEEASPVVADNPKDYHPPCHDHIKRVLARHKPTVVVSFTKAGESVIRWLCPCPVLSAPHPAARQADVLARLLAVGDKLQLLVRNAARDARAEQTALEATREGDDEGRWMAMALRAECQRFEQRMLSDLAREGAR